MKKKYLFTLVLISTFNLLLNSQCTIVPLSEGFIVPDSSTETIYNGDTVTLLKSVEPNVAYESVIQVRVPKDTVVDYLGNTVLADFDNVALDSVTNMPSGLSYACNPFSCVFNGQSDGCVIISGTVATADTGVYRLILNITANMLVNGFIPVAQEVKDSTFLLAVGVAPDTSGNLGVKAMVINNLTQLDVYPNPLQGEGTVSFYVKERSDVELRIIDMLGNIVHKRNFNSVHGLKTLSVNAKELGSGVYFISLTNGVDAVTKKIMINR